MCSAANNILLVFNGHVHVKDDSCQRVIKWTLMSLSRLSALLNTHFTAIR